MIAFAVTELSRDDHDVERRQFLLSLNQNIPRRPGE